MQPRPHRSRRPDAADQVRRAISAAKIPQSGGIRRWLQMRGSARKAVTVKMEVPAYGGVYRVRPADKLERTFLGGERKPRL